GNLWGREEQVAAAEIAGRGNTVHVERRRHDPDNRYWNAVHRHRRTDCRGVFVEALPPQLMTENDHRLQCAGCALFFGVQPSPLRLQSEHVEKRSGREDSDEALRLVDAGEVDAL